MDDNTNVSQERHGDNAVRSVCALKLIRPSEWPPERLEWLWKKLSSQEYAFDDPAKGNPQAFLGQLFEPTSAWFEIGDVGIVSCTGIVPKVSCFIHFAMWEDVDLKEFFPIQKELFGELFTKFELNRLTAFIPSFNKQGIRMATITGFKYEGEMRKAFLKNGTYHNVQLYGLLKDEFYKREVKH